MGITKQRNDFPKQIRLNSKKRIELLFTKKNTIFCFPFKIFIAESESNKETIDQFDSVLISVSKRQFKNAVDRNRVKRVFREAYRTNKNLIEKNHNNKIQDIAFVYVHSEILSYDEMKKKIVLCLRKINQFS